MEDDDDEQEEIQGCDVKRDHVKQQLTFLQCVTMVKYLCKKFRGNYPDSMRLSSEEDPTTHVVTTKKAGKIELLSQYYL